MALARHFPAVGRRRLCGRGLGISVSRVSCFGGDARETLSRIRPRIIRRVSHRKASIAVRSHSKSSRSWTREEPFGFRFWFLFRQKSNFRRIWWQTMGSVWKKFPFFQQSRFLSVKLCSTKRKYLFRVEKYSALCAWFTSPEPKAIFVCVAEEASLPSTSIFPLNFAVASWRLWWPVTNWPLKTNTNSSRWQCGC